MQVALTARNSVETGSSQRQEDCLEFEASLSYITRLYLKTELSQAVCVQRPGTREEVAGVPGVKVPCGPVSKNEKRKRPLCPPC